MVNMKVILETVAISLLVASAAAQSQCLSITSQFPDCVAVCVTSAASAVGCTNTLDLSCQCSSASSAAILASALPCVQSACSGDSNAIVSGVGVGNSVCSCIATATTEPPSPVTPANESTGPITPAPTCNEESPCETSAQAVPECGKSCILDAAVSSAGCGTADYECQCSSFDAIQSGAAPCVISACGAQTAVAVLGAVSTLCGCVEASPSTPCSTAEPTGDPSSPSDSSGDTTVTSSPPSGTEPPTGDDCDNDGGDGGEEGPEPTATCSAGGVPDCGPGASSAVPECAQPCFRSAAPSVGCGADDYSCQCESEAQESLSQILVPCVATACPGESLPAVIAGASSVCACMSAAPTEGDCSAPGGSDTSEPTPEVTTPPSSPTSPGGGSGGDGDMTCELGTTADCEPVASSAIPACAQGCFTSYAPSVGCDVSDFGCQCQPAAQSSLSSLLVPCVATACPAESLPAVITGASAVCECANAAPTGGPCSSGGGNGGSGGSSGGNTGTEDTPTPTPTNPSSDNGGGSTCEDTPASDCAPVASTAIPECAQPCFTSAAPGVGCDVNDFACQCGDAAQQSLSQLLVPCVATACDAAALPSVIAGASSVCACATAAPGDSCGSPGNGNGNDNGGGGSSPTPTKTSGSSGGSTCNEAPISDCAPVASTAIPECAQPCFTSAAPGVGCNVTDFACHCEHAAQQSLSQLLVPCVATACDAAALPSVIAGASSVCACATAALGGSSCGGSGGSGSGGSGSGSDGSGSQSGGSNSGGSGSNGSGSGSSGSGSGSGGSGSGSGSGAEDSCITVTMTQSPNCAALESSIEPCAMPCFTSAIPEIGCELTDFACQCGSDNKASLSSLLLPCVQTACDAAVLPSLIAEADAVCECATGSSGGVVTTTSCAVGGGSTLGTSTPTGMSGPTGAPPVVGSAGRFELGVVGGMVLGTLIAAVAL